MLTPFIKTLRTVSPINVPRPNEIYKVTEKNLSLLRILGRKNRNDPFTLWCQDFIAEKTVPQCTCELLQWTACAMLPVIAFNQFISTDTVYSRFSNHLYTALRIKAQKERCSWPGFNCAPELIFSNKEAIAGSFGGFLIRTDQAVPGFIPDLLNVVKPY